jgi:pilus assembly protein CpaE
MTPLMTTAPPTGDTFLFASDNGTNIALLVNALQRRGVVEPVALAVQALDERIAALSPQAVFLDFSGTQAVAAAEVHRQLKRDWPALAILGAGSSAEPAAMLGALRSGVDDFIDVTAALAEINGTLVALLQRRSAAMARVRGRTIALLGARGGLGVTTLATNMALLLQESLARRPAAATPTCPADAPRGTALLDLGLPARDGLLQLDMPSTFSFVDGVQNVRRLDQTLVQTAIAHHASGAAVLPLPASLAQVRDISHADSAALVRRMAEFFDYQVADLGNFSATDFLAHVVQAADKTWVVCDQSIGAIVSTANLLRELQARGIEPQRLALVVNKLDANVSVSARDIAARLGLSLEHVLPMRRTALLAASARGEVLARSTHNDPYVLAVQGMVRSLQRKYAPDDVPALAESRGAALMARLIGKLKSAREG